MSLNAENADLRPDLQAQARFKHLSDLASGRQRFETASKHDGDMFQCFNCFKMFVSQFKGLPGRRL